MNKLQVFSNENFSVRTVTDADGTIWFVARDIAEALEYSESSINQVNNLFASVPNVWSDHKRIMFRSENGILQSREMLCLTEQGIYFFLGRSDKPKALPYQIWIAGDVVPSIRETGSYSVSSNNKNVPLEFQREQLNFERAKLLKDIMEAPIFPLTDESKAVIQHEIFKILTGHEGLSMFPAMTEKWYSASDIATIIGLSANMVGRIANENGLKAPEGESNKYGRWIFSKSKYSSKECPQFIYNENAVEWFIEHKKSIA